MKPMEPMREIEAWWPKSLGKPNTSGGQDDLKYAYFADSRRLAISWGGKVTLYGTGDHKISGVGQQQGGGRGDITFRSQDGELTLSELKEVDH